MRLRNFAWMLGLSVLPALAPLAGAQTGTLDQTSPAVTTNSTGLGSTNNWQQPVRVGIGGYLEGFTMSLFGPQGVQNTVNLAIRLGPAWNTNLRIWTGTATVTSGFTEFVFFDTTSAAIALQPGDVFVIETYGGSQFIATHGNFGGYPEQLYYNGSTSCSIGVCDLRLDFKTYMVSSLPGPKLTVTGATSPGTGTATVNNATPGGLVGVGYSTSLGSSTVNTGAFCGVVTTPLKNPKTVAVGAANAAGTFSVSRNIPAGFAGLTVNVWGFDVASCTGTNVVTATL